MSRHYDGPERRRRVDVPTLLERIDTRTEAIDRRTERLEAAVFFGADGDTSTSIVSQLAELRGAKRNAPVGARVPKWAKTTGVVIGTAVTTVLGWLAIAKPPTASGQP